VLRRLANGDLGLKGCWLVEEDLDYLESLLPTARRGCSRCDLELTTVNRYLDGLSYENVNDVQVRAELRAARGFCNHHAWQFVDVARDNLGTALIYRDVLGTVVAELRPIAEGSVGSRVFGLLSRTSLQAGPAVAQTLRGLLPNGPCPTCEALATAIADRGRGISNPCLPHLRAALATSGGFARTELERAWAATLRGLRRSVGNASSVEPDRRGPGPRHRGTLLDLVEAAFGKRGTKDTFSRPPSAPGPPPDRVREASSELEALVNPDECPICLLVGRRVKEELRAGGRTFPEQVAALISAGDLCNVHAWFALDLSGGPEEARRHPLTVGHLELLQKRGGTEGAATGCRACALRSQWELAYAGQLAELALACSDRATPEGAALCVPHLALVFRVAPPEKAAALARREIRACQRLREELAEYIRKQDYRFREEPRGVEEMSPLRALAIVAGGRGFGRA